MRIFLMEDDPHYRRALKSYLELLGHEVIDSEDPSGCPIYNELAEECQHDFPCGDMLLIDNNMPKMTGLEFLKRQSERGCKGMMKNKALMSAGLSDEERDQAREMGCQVFTKPFRLYRLREWIEDAILEYPEKQRLHNFEKPSVERSATL